MDRKALYLTELRSVADWQARLGDPVKHWRRGASAMELAVEWLSARSSESGLPKAVGQLLDSRPETRGARLALAVPERRTPLDGGSTASQSDLWALLENAQGKISLIVEGKAAEPFDQLVRDWKGPAPTGTGRKSGKPERLRSICQRLGIDENAVEDIRYQLLHRTAATMIEAEYWGARTGVMLVERFSAAPDVPAPSFRDFENFAALFGLQPKPGELHALPSQPGILIGWLDVPFARDEEILSVVAP